jgi:hypothetical protein
LVQVTPPLGRTSYAAFRADGLYAIDGTQAERLGD